MNISTKTLNSGFTMPVFGLGTSGFGEGDELTDRDQVAAIIRAIENGITHIDTAEIYAGGRSEILVGRAIQHFDRAKLFISTKVAYENLSYEGVTSSLQGSLKRMGIDYIDLYMIHRPNKNIPIAETMRALKEAKEKGLIKYVGVSNFNLEELKEAESVFPDLPIVAGQYHFSLKTREAERRNIVDYFQEHDKMLIAWRPVDKGRLATSDEYILRRVALKYQKSPSQVAISWLISQRNVVTLSRMSTQGHLEENLGALGWIMDNEDVNDLDLAFPDQEDVSRVVPLN